MGSKTCDYAAVGAWAIVGEGAVVTARSVVPDGKVAVGMPAKPTGDVMEDGEKVWSFYKQKCARRCERYKVGLTRIG